MRLLVLGGTVFLSRAVAAEAVRRGHPVTCAARGHSGDVPDGATLVHLDRTSPDWSALEPEYDAVVDVARTPSWVRSALDALGDRAPHWTFVSSISVYADTATSGGTPDNLPLLAPIAEDVVQDTPEKYGASKVACEQLVRETAAEPFVVRPGLIVGPGDPTGRFTYWPERIADGGTLLAPESADLPVQVIDVRDLAAWIVTAAEQRLTGTLEATGPATTLGATIEEVAAGCRVPAEPEWVDADFLLARDVRPWAGPRSIPLWLPAEARGMVTHDLRRSVAAGLTTRPLAETARDTLDWARASANVTRTGLTRAEEADLLQQWRAGQGPRPVP